MVDCVVNAIGRKTLNIFCNQPLIRKVSCVIFLFYETKPYFCGRKSNIFSHEQGKSRLPHEMLWLIRNFPFWSIHRTKLNWLLKVNVWIFKGKLNWKEELQQRSFVPVCAPEGHVASRHRKFDKCSVMFAKLYMICMCRHTGLRWLVCAKGQTFPCTSNK